MHFATILCADSREDNIQWDRVTMSKCLHGHAICTDQSIINDSWSIYQYINTCCCDYYR